MSGSISNPVKKALAQRILPLCLCCMAVVAVQTHPAMAQSRDLVNRITRLENELETLNRAVYRGETPPSPSASAVAVQSDLLVRVQQLETELRNLTGKIEQQAYDIQQIQMRLDGLAQDSGMRLDAVEAQLRTLAAQPVTAPAPASVAAPGAPQALQQTAPVIVSGDGVAPTASVAPLNPQANANILAADDAAGLYEQGFSEIRREDYAAAEASFRRFIDQYAEHPLTPNAYYWLGETYYVRQNFSQAARTFAEAYQKFPNGPKAADNLLKLGMSLAGADKKEDACIALRQLKREYPNGPAPILARADQEIANLKCSG